MSTGTEALLQLAADLAEAAPEVRGGYHLGRGAGSLTHNVAIEGPEQAQLANGPARMEG